MNPKLTLLLALTASLTLSSCVAPTGDPRQGGLFGWSESMAQDRLAQRQGTLNAIRDDTAQREARNRQLQSQYNNMR